MELATFGAGCFWCVEAVFDRINGVKSVKSGYSGGELSNPTYEQVCSGTTKHAEVLQIAYDEAVVSFAKLLEVFFRVHNPTTLNRQSNDVGTQYRSVVFYHNVHQKDLTTSAISALDEDKVYDAAIVTEVSPLTKFWPAEDMHSNYFAKNPEQSYCAMVVRPKVEKFEKVFASLLK